MLRQSRLRYLRPILALICALIPLMGQFSGSAMAEKGHPNTGPTAAATTPFATIGQGTPAAPLKINLGNDLSYQIFYNYNDGSSINASGQVFPSNGQLADAGDLLWIGGTVYGPDFSNHDSGSAFCGGAITPFTPVSQSQSGSGTSNDPYRVITRVTAGSIQIDETVSLVNSDHFATIRRILTNTTGAAVTLSLFHAADIYLKGSDSGYGYRDNGSQSVGGYNQTKDWYEIFTPVDPPQRFQETAYCDLWNQISTSGAPGGGLASTIDADTYQDNGIALRWDRTLNASQSTSIQDFHSFGILPLIPSAPGVCLSPSPVVFGSQVVGTSSPSQFVTLNNCGNAPLVIGTLTLGGTNPGDFTFTSSCAGLTIAAGSSCGIRITFTPTATGARSAQISITDNAGNNPQALLLSGTGIPPHPPYTLIVKTSGPCDTTTVTPAGPNYANHTSVTLTPHASAGAVFIGWRSGTANTPKGWADPWTFQMNDDYTITAVCVPQPSFPDYAPSTPVKTDPIIRLAALGIIRGYQSGNFGPADTTLRAQMAALIARGMGWDAEEHGNFFPDRGTIDDNLWRNVGTLYYYNVARGYSDGTYNPTGEVLYAQTISFIVRGMVTNGYWTQVPDSDPTLYPAVTVASGHRSDIATYVHYAGALPDVPVGQPFSQWSQPSPRVWFSRAEWQALDSYFNHGFLP